MTQASRTVLVPIWRLSVALAVLFGAGNALASEQKTTLCHVPPGAPDNAHEIVVSDAALESHLANHPGDLVGSCQARCEVVGACDDGNACTIDSCNADGSCDNSQPVDCSDGNVCTLDTCNAETGCENPQVPDADQLACDDGNTCSANDVCVAGSCSGSPIPSCCTSDADCPASDACMTSFCEDATSTCVEVDLSSQCTAGACEVAFCDPVNGCGTAPATCPDDGNICTTSECNPLICGETGGCETFANPNPPEPGTEVTCDDGLDNDCDGLADFLDEDCIEPCPCAGLSLWQESAWANAVLPFCIESDSNSSTSLEAFSPGQGINAGIENDRNLCQQVDDLQNLTQVLDITDAERESCRELVRSLAASRGVVCEELQPAP